MPMSDRPRLAGHNYLNMLQRDAVPQTAMLFEHEPRSCIMSGLKEDVADFVDSARLNLAFSAPLLSTFCPRMLGRHP
jgi:hypothetical protein